MRASLKCLIPLSILLSTAHAETVWRGCDLVKVVDGDTVVLSCTGWDKPQRVRIVGYNSPERCQPGYDASTQWLKDTLSHAVRTDAQAPQALAIEELARDSYGRVLARLYHFNDSVKMVQVIAPPEHRAKRVKCENGTL